MSIKQFDFSKPSTPESERLTADEQLKSDLEACISARALIPIEQAKIRQLWDAATNQIERDARAWQYDLVSAQIERAAKIAEVRIARLDHLKQTGGYEEEKERCRDSATGTLHWFKFYAWGFDPREDSPLPVQPFYPFDFQRRYIEWLESLVFNRHTSGLVEKSRDMGATVGALLWCIKHWLFRPHFSAFLSSATEDLVDSQKDPDTLFEKVRFQLRRTPSWMLPVGFDLLRDMPYMNIANPENNSTITGAAPTRKVGRQRRRTVVIKDESASWPFGGYPQHTALSQTARSVIDLSTPEGKFNKYSDIAHDGKTPKFVMDWRHHPWKGGEDRKDTRWYNALPFGYVGPAMDAAAIAQEIDRDYEASQPGRIFPLAIFNEIYSVITWSEFKRVYGVAHIPTNWNLGRCQDVGTSEGHPNVTTWSAKPRKDAPYSDTIFFFREYLPPLDWPVEWIGEGQRNERGDVIADGIQQLETPLKEAPRMVISLISHEGTSEQRTYQYTCKRYPILFSKIQKPEANAGLSEMRALMKPIPDEANPFVFYPENHPLAGQSVMGRSRFIIIVADEEGELQWDGERLYRAQPQTSAGMVRLRGEIPLYHYPETEKDKPVAQRKPFKRFDDAIDTARYQCRLWGPPNAKPSAEEEFENQLPENLRMENIPRPTPERRLTPKEQEEAADLIIAREVMISEKGLKKKSKKAVHFRNRRFQR